MGDILATVVVLGLFGIASISILMIVASMYAGTETMMELDMIIAEKIRRRKERRADK